MLLLKDRSGPFAPLSQATLYASAVRVCEAVFLEAVEGSWLLLMWQALN